jgi:hypothetical protein
MPKTLELPDDLANALTDDATRLGLSLSDYALRVLASTRQPQAEIRTGADLVAYWQREGLIGSLTDDVDSSVEARRLREQAQRRAG